MQSVVLEYITGRIITEASDEIQSGKLSRITTEHGFELAQAREYVRKIQQRLIVAPILERMSSAYPLQTALEAHLIELLRELADWDDITAQGYAPANLVTLLRSVHGNLRELDLSRLVLGGVYLQGIDMQDAMLSGSMIQDCIFTETFDSMTAVAISSNGAYWAASSRRGELWVWEADRQILLRTWPCNMLT